jgi:succinoglycan biosynthesis protein ExoA
MPLYNEAEDIADVLESLTQQTYAHQAMFAVIVDGGSTDGSRETAQRWLADGDIPGILVDNPRRTIPTSLNLGIAHARPDDIVVRLDAHTTYGPDYVRSIAVSFSRVPPSIGCIGGAQTPRPERRVDLALVTALYTNPVGLGGAGFRRITGRALVPGVYLGAWRPGILDAAGGFDESWVANEDGELAARVRRLGYATLLLPIHSEYRVKRGPLAAIRQWGRYGFWRAQTLLRHPKELRLRHLAPPLALGLSGILLLTPFRAAIGLLFAAYATAVWLYRDRHEAPLVTLLSTLFFPACQIAWGCGLLWGLIAPAARGPAPSAGRLRRTGVEPVKVSGKVYAGGPPWVGADIAQRKSTVDGNAQPALTE